MTDQHEILTTEEIAERLRALGYSISAQGVRKHMRQGRAGFEKGGRWFGTPGDVNRLLQWVGGRGPEPGRGTRARSSGSASEGG